MCLTGDERKKKAESSVNCEELLKKYLEIANQKVAKGLLFGDMKVKWQKIRQKMLKCFWNW